MILGTEQTDLLFGIVESGGTKSHNVTIGFDNLHGDDTTKQVNFPVTPDISTGFAKGKSDSKSCLSGLQEMEQPVSTMQCRHPCKKESLS